MNKPVLSYLACPYSHENESVRNIRFLTANFVASRLISQGTYVYSPLTHNVPLDHLETGSVWAHWCTFDTLMLSRCDKLILLKMPGWESSSGVQAEIAYAKQHGIPIEEIDPPQEKLVDELSKENVITDLINKLEHFYQVRDWNQFHSPKNLAMNLATEVGELLEPFRWLTETQSQELSEQSHQHVRDEIGDVFNMLVYLSHKLNIDPLQASHDKIIKMGLKYPAHLCKGKALKYTAYENV